MDETHTGLSNQPEAQAPAESAAPWGFWATVGLSLSVGILFLVLSTTVGVGFVLKAKRENPEANFEFSTAGGRCS